MSVLGEAGENYLEAILLLEDEKGEVRSVDVANRLEVSRPSVNKAVGILKQLGMVEQALYGNISLTEKGRKHASLVAKRHKVLKHFLAHILNLDEQTAEEEACRMEHVVSDKTVEKLIEYVESKVKNADSSEAER